VRVPNAQMAMAAKLPGDTPRATAATDGDAKRMT
jgi:hypothetical protein